MRREFKPPPDFSYEASEVEILAGMPDDSEVQYLRLINR